MKNKILLLLSITISTFCIAQTPPTFGIRAGITSAGMRGDAVNNLNDLIDFSKGIITTSNRNGLYAGVYSNISLGDILSVEPGLYYSQKGYEMKGSLNIKVLEFLGVGAKTQLQSQYLDLPVMLKANFNGLQVFAGPQVSYLMQSDLRTTAGALGFNVLDTKTSTTDYFNRWDAGVSGGIGYEFVNGINLSASYDHGLTKVDANRNMASYNKVFKIGLGYKF
jgi:hypothetical protein